MSIPKRAIGSAVFLCLALSTIHASELLYTVGGNTVKVYSVNSTTAVTKLIGSVKLPSSHGAQITRTVNTPFLYAFGFNSSNQEFLWTYKLNAFGVPGAKPIQTLPVKNALNKFVILPNGKFAYGFYEWSMPDPNNHGTTGYAGDAVRFTINTTTGMLTNTKKAVVNFPLDDFSYPELLGMNTKGTVMYTVQLPVFFGIEATYTRSTVNPTTGAVSGTAHFWQDDYPDGAGVTGIGNLYLAEQWPDPPTRKYAINIYPNAGGPNVLIRCDEFMVAVCGDQDGNMLFDPTGKYLLFDDFTISEVPILYVSVVNGNVVASGASIPGNAYSITFSPTGLLLYGLERGEVLVYVFNPHSGLLTAKSTIADSSVYALVPIK
jgi:hypothetical protein